MTPVPAATPEALHYLLVSNAFWAGDQAVGIVLPLLLLLTGGAWRLRDALFTRRQSRAWWATPIFALVFFGLDRLCRLPIGWFWERAYEISRGSTPPSVVGWLAGEWAGALGEVLGLSLLVTAVSLLCRRAPRFAWIVAGATLSVAAAAWLVLEPFTQHGQPMGAGRAERVAVDILARAGVPERSVLLETCEPVDACPPGHVIGLGPTRLLVLNATRLHTVPVAWTVQTAAHEAKHFVKDDNLKALWLLAGLSFLAAWVATAGTDALAHRWPRFGVAGVLDPAALPLAVLLLGVLHLLLLPPLNAFRQDVELQADRFALELTGDGRSQGEMLAHDASAPGRVPTLDRFYLLFRATHPSDAERIELSNQYSR